MTDSECTEDDVGYISMQMGNDDDDGEDSTFEFGAHACGSADVPYLSQRGAAHLAPLLPSGYLDADDAWVSTEKGPIDKRKKVIVVCAGCVTRP